MATYPFPLKSIPFRNRPGEHTFLNPVAFKKKSW
jgi:hypothetical protein